ncbi:MAG: nitrogen fixation protein NifY [Magnetococcales bacterium]|nr:nitrogen fixation protein NifY [Magnetococcales bacterium]
MMDAHELALRIGLAARSVPGIATADVVKALAVCLGFPLTETRLAGLRPAALATALAACARPPSGAEAEQVVQWLQRPADPEDSAGLAASRRGPTPGSVRVACAVNRGGEVLDGHFGSCKGFAIFDVSPEGVMPVGTRFCFPAAFQEEEGEQDGNQRRLQLVRDCRILCVQSIGGPAAARVTQAGLMPLRLAGDPSLAEVLERIRQSLATAPPPWLAREMNRC